MLPLYAPFQHDLSHRSIVYPQAQYTRTDRHTDTHTLTLPLWFWSTSFRARLSTPERKTLETMTCFSMGSGRNMCESLMSFGRRNCLVLLLTDKRSCPSRVTSYLTICSTKLQQQVGENAMIEGKKHFYLAKLQANINRFKFVKAVDGGRGGQVRAGTTVQVYPD